MDRHWFLTWTCYGTWLPGDHRGFVGNVRENGEQVIHNIPGAPCDADMPRLEAWVHERMTGPPVILACDEAETILTQFQQTARVKQWSLLAASVMHNHAHIIVGVSGDPEPQMILETFKSWATRALKKICPLPLNGTFWTAKGSKRRLADEVDVIAGIIYVVKKQPNPLAVWYAPERQTELDKYPVEL